MGLPQVKDTALTAKPGKPPSAEAQGLGFPMRYPHPSRPRCPGRPGSVAISPAPRGAQSARCRAGAEGPPTPATRSLILDLQPARVAHSHGRGVPVVTGDRGLALGVWVPEITNCPHTTSNGGFRTPWRGSGDRASREQSHSSRPRAQAPPWCEPPECHDFLPGSRKRCPGQGPNTSCEKNAGLGLLQLRPRVTAETPSL